MQILLSLVAIAIATTAVVFSAIQTRIFSRQATILQTTTELSYNLEVIVQMNDTLLRIASDPASRVYVWGDAPEDGYRAHHLGRALLDLLDAAISGVYRLPAFENWREYVEYVLEHSPNLRDEARAHRRWWPAVAPIADKLAERWPTAEDS